MNKKDDKKSAKGAEPKSNKRKRKATPGFRHRRDNGPSELQVLPVPPPSPTELGTVTLHTEGIIKGGADELIRAHKEAARLSAKFGEVFEEKWFLLTPWLRQLRLTHRARARYALTWRPRFLATVALSRSVMMGARAARVSPQTVMAHRRADPDFEAQVMAAEEHAVELLHDVTFKSALEGDCEPVFWQGIQVGHIKKFDNRLRIEMLRAHMPDKFKTPGSKAPLVSGDGNNILICDAATTAKLVEMRQSALHDMAEKRAKAIPIN
jgi:hypothetical protein